jgi:hypothetical protein
MKVSLIALYTCCAVSSAAFAYQNNPQGGQSPHAYAIGKHGAQFVVRDDPGANPPKAAVMDDPGANPPKAAVMDDPGANPPKASMMASSGVSPSRRH